MRTSSLLIMLTVAAAAVTMPGARADDHHSTCYGAQCPRGEVTDGAVEVEAQFVSDPDAAGVRIASNAAPAGPVLYTWRLQPPCTARDATTVSCDSRSQRTCPQIPGRVIQFWLVDRQRLAQPGGAAVDGLAPTGNPVPGTPFDPWDGQGSACVDVTALDLAPTPAAVFEYFQRLPLPQLTTQHQPPGDGLAQLPVIFYTDAPTSQTFTVDIRGFTVEIVAGATAFTWHTGDGTELTSTDPGAPYPNQTVSHDYASGTYTARLTVTWGATFRVDGGVSTDVPGTTTTDGPPVTFDVRQARPVLTNPYD